jgi:uncharacterized membrane protein
MVTMSNEPHVAAAGRGASWWGEGVHLFTASIGTWIGIMLIYLLISALISVVPYVGSVGHWLLTPVFMGGMMIGCNALRHGEPLRVAHLFEGFQGAHFVPLMIIGAVNIAISFGLIALAGATIIGGLKMADLARLGSTGDPYSMFLGSARALTGTSLLVTLLVVVIATVFAMLNWFAPAMVALRGVSAVEAMKASFLSCLRNWAPFLVYGLIAMGVGIVAVLAFVALAVMFGAGAFISGTTSGGWGALIGFFVVIFVMMAVAALVVGPIVFGSTYAGYEDTLGGDDPALENPAYH